MSRATKCFENDKVLSASLNFKMRSHLRATLLKGTWPLTKSCIEVLIGTLNTLLLYAKWEFLLKCFKQ